MSQTLNAAITVVGIDIGKNSFHIVGHDERGAIVLRQKWSRGRIASRLSNVPPCLIGIEAGMATHYVARELAALGHDVKQVPPTYARKPAVSRCSIARAALRGRAADQPHRAGHPRHHRLQETNKALDKCGDNASSRFPLTLLRLWFSLQGENTDERSTSGRLRCTPNSSGVCPVQDHGRRRSQTSPVL